ncbi:MAG: hypothetical protein KME40_27760 [Komarekiella atlantica HA4396-MV6]|jgi:hypothetical protein|nr:hypothetical protein [Komarekiella atlantica HA4396-MV6]
MRKKFTEIALIAATFVGSLTLASSNAYAQNPQVQEYLYTIEQNLKLTEINRQSNCNLSRIFGELDNNISCMGAEGNACTVTIVYLAALQDLINQGLLLPQDRKYRNIHKDIISLRIRSGCAG